MCYFIWTNAVCCHDAIHIFRISWSRNKKRRRLLESKSSQFCWVFAGINIGNRGGPRRLCTILRANFFINSLFSLQHAKRMQPLQVSRNIFYIYTIMHFGVSNHPYFLLIHCTYLFFIFSRLLFNIFDSSYQRIKWNGHMPKRETMKMQM